MQIQIHTSFEIARDSQLCDGLPGHVDAALFCWKQSSNDDNLSQRTLAQCSHVSVCKEMQLTSCQLSNAAVTQQDTTHLQPDSSS